jgi:hypothetical protein
MVNMVPVVVAVITGKSQVVVTALDSLRFRNNLVERGHIIF